MINDLDVVQWAYLLDPTVQLVNTAGKPLTDGYIEVYIAGSRNKYYCASDFDGTLHPFQIPLDSLGSNIILANPENAYDVYVYNRFGSLVMSRYNVTPADGGAVISNTERINDLEEMVVSAVTGLQGQIDDINEALDGKKDKQEEYSVTFTPTQTVSAIMQNENGEIEVIYQEIDLPEEVPNVNIVSPASTINITTHIDEETNTKTFSIDLSDLGHLEYGQYMATQDVFTGANMYRIKGNLGTTLDGKIQLHKGNSYHITVRGYYTCLDLNNTVDTLNYIEYSSYTTMPVNVDNTVAGPQYFEISYDIFKLSADTEYYIAFASSAGKVSDLTVEIHSLSNISIVDLTSTFDAGWGINIVSSVISVDPSIIPESQVQSDWTEDDTDDPAYIKHKPIEYDLVAGNNISIDVQGSAVVISSTTSSEFATDAEVFNATVTAIEAVSAMIPDAQVQSDWTEYDPDNPAYIKNKPSIPADKVYVFWDSEFNRTAIRAAIDAHKVIMCWNSTSHEHSYFSRYEEKIIDGNLCEVYHFAHVETDYVTPFATDWRLGDMAYIYDTVREIDWAEHDTKLFNHEVPDPTSSDDGKVLTASWDSNQASGSWSWQPVTGFATEAEVYNATVTAIEIATGFIPDSEDVQFEEIDLSNYALVSAIPTVELNGNDQVTAIDGYTLAGGGGGTTYTAGDHIGIVNDEISVTGITELVAGNAITITTSGVSAIISSTGEAQVQSDWSVTDSSSKAYIKNKPTIPDAQVQSNWNETNTSSKAYIQNKPTIHTYTGASGVAINNDTITLDNPIGLVAGDNITIEVSGVSAIISAQGGGGGGTTYTAGQYIAIDSNDVISVTGVAAASAIPTLPDTEEVTFEELDLSDYALASAIPTFTAGNCIDITSNAISWETTAGITDIQLVSALPASPVSSVLYLIPET